MSTYEDTSEEDAFSADVDDATVEPINAFLEQNFDISQFNARKGVYLMLMNTKPNDILKHLNEAYALLNFWRFMFLRLIAEIQNGTSGASMFASDATAKVLQEYARKNPSEPSKLS